MPKLGATGKFPDGRLSETDEGEIRFAIRNDERGNVLIDFGKPVAWLAMPPELAVQLAVSLMHHAGVKVP